MKENKLHETGTRRTSVVFGTLATVCLFLVGGLLYAIGMFAELATTPRRYIA